MEVFARTTADQLTQSLKHQQRSQSPKKHTLEVAYEPLACRCGHFVFACKEHGSGGSNGGSGRAGAGCPGLPHTLRACAFGSLACFCRAAHSREELTG